jgi:hypothetical protein
VTEKPPNPGTREALALGCTCPVLDNAHGRGYLGGMKDEHGETLFVYTSDCPIHPWPPMLQQEA